MKRVVIDTNVLVSAAYDEDSASWRIIEACLRGDLTALLSPELRQEYERIMERAVRIRGYEERVRQFLAAAEPVTTRGIPRAVPEDPEDDKVIATAVAGMAEVILTSDRHLLDLDPFPAGDRNLRVLRPETFERLRTEESGGEWKSVLRFLGIGR